jgi:hypothetical protein
LSNIIKKEKLKNNIIKKTMDDMCSLMSDIKISTEILLNIDTWQQDQLDFRGMYKELITSQRIYKLYSYGIILTVGKNGPGEIKQIKLVERGGDLMVIAY